MRRNLHDLVLGTTTELLDTVLLLLDVLAGLLDRSLQARADEAVLRLELLESLNAVVDQTKPSGLAATKRRAEPEDGHALLIGDVVHLSNLLLELSLCDQRDVVVSRRALNVVGTPRAARVLLGSKNPSAANPSYLGDVRATRVEHVNDLRWIKNIRQFSFTDSTLRRRRFLARPPAGPILARRPRSRLLGPGVGSRARRRVHVRIDGAEGGGSS